ISEIFSVEMKFFDQYQEDRRTDRFDNIIPLYKRNNL
ncbi:TPA: DNA-binding protein, partial [Streptococcus pneumoniae]|nr:DNA-binding protein [Streptococcus pneumoniae]